VLGVHPRDLQRLDRSVPRPAIRCSQPALRVPCSLLCSLTSACEAKGDVDLSIDCSIVSLFYLVLRFSLQRACIAGACASEFRAASRLSQKREAGN
jgi:hypothetical protein